MKKILAILLVVVMVFGCVACGAANDNNTEAGKGTDKEASAGTVDKNTSTIKNANEILTKVWASYIDNAEEDLQLTIGGGNLSTMLTDEPATFDLTLDDAKEELTTAYCIPEKTIKKVDDVATMVNMMMAKNFTCAAIHVKDAKDVKTVVSDIEKATLNNHWIGGFPDKFIIVTIEENYVVTAFGNSMVIDELKDAITAVYGDVAVFSVEKNIE